MAKLLTASLLLALAACSSVPPVPATASACAAGENTYDCQVERYNSVNVE
jgi:hypothetical protein